MTINWSFVVFILSVQSVQSSGLQSYSSPNCSQFANDGEILRRFPFGVATNPFPADLSKTYTTWNADQTVRVLKIVNEKYVPPTVVCFKSLEELYIQNTTLYQRDFQGNLIRRFLPGISNLRRTLKVFVIQNTYLPYLSDEVGQLSNLISFEASNTGLLSLFATIGNLPLLDDLYVPGNQLSSFPETLKNNLKLRRLMASNNPKLRSLEALNGHPSLQMLIAENCSIERIPVDLPMLFKLSLSNNKLIDLDNIQSIGSEQPKEKRFYFSNNRIRFIPWEIRLVKRLDYFNVSGNHLNNLPTDIFEVTTLTTLDIRWNPFRGEDLREIVQKFNRTNPKLRLFS